MTDEPIMFTLDYPEVTEPVMVDPKEAYIAALLREREAAPRLGHPERIKEIDAELERAGYVDPESEASKPAPKPTAAPKGRSAPERVTVARKTAT